ncbi:hypothetical protein KDA23_05795 [Candidatus Saccharibacteria bacterium]|nr:hypothetical protein [Candidatus Saccharibacteria bacterium]
MHHNRLHSHNRWTLKEAGAALSAVIFMLGVAWEVDNFKAVPSYVRQYTDDSKCLAGTPYDPLENAAVYPSDYGLDIVPIDANYQTPSVLRLEVHRHGLLSPTFMSADPASAALLEREGCPGAREGGL